MQTDRQSDVHRQTEQTDKHIDTDIPVSRQAESLASRNPGR